MSLLVWMFMTDRLFLEVRQLVILEVMECFLNLLWLCFLFLFSLHILCYIYSDLNVLYFTKAWFNFWVDNCICLCVFIYFWTLDFAFDWLQTWRSPLLRIQNFLRFSLFKHGVGQSKALHALSTARCSTASVPSTY